LTPEIAAILCALGILGLVRLDSDRGLPTSPALWIPVVWTSLGASRMLSEWLGFGGPIASPDQYLDGSPIDRAFLSALLAVAGGVLVWRRRRSASLLRANAPLLVFFLYCAASVLWSDYPMVAFKRWTKAAGNVVMVLVVLTDAHPAQAIRRFFARVGFLLVPVSVLLIAYFPHLGREFHWWTGQPFYTGVTTDKNSLGAICLVFGLAALWRVVEGLRAADGAPGARAIAPSAIVLVLVLWLLYMADSSTALVSFLLGGLLLLYAAGASVTSTSVHAIVAGLCSAALAVYLSADSWGWVVGLLGEDMSLTGRTRLWNDLLRVELNPWIGTGFETFWLGDRARLLWDKYLFRPNQAHNGYPETYITLGWAGLGLLVWLIASGYRNVIHGLRRNVPAGSLKLTLLVVALVYSITEAAFRVMHPVWIAFLLAIIAIPDDPASDGATRPSTASRGVGPIALDRPGGEG
jgi:hypothetical protein